MYFRSTSRIFQDGGLWYFYTREGTVEGPYGAKRQAERMLESYIQTMTSRFAPPPDLRLVDEPQRQRKILR
jgi:hypothetical protein